MKKPSRLLSRPDFETRIDAARGLIPCDLVLKNTEYLDVFTGRWHWGEVAIHHGVIVGLETSVRGQSVKSVNKGNHRYRGNKEVDLKGLALVPGFIDSHVHVESTLMVPKQFETAVLPRGTTGAILDPHEIVNVMGTKGLDYILECAMQSHMDLFIMLSSCVPATHLETSGAQLKAQDLLPYKNHPHVLGLAELMNYPGLLNKDPEVLDKVVAFQDGHIDGHSPMLVGKDLNAYLACGVKTCHESVSLKEAQEKIEKGMQVLLREGSVAKNLRELVKVLTAYASPFVSLCTDDRNPADILEEGHLDYLIRLAIRSGIKPEVAYRVASLSTARCYGLKSKGAIAPSYDADMVILKNKRECIVGGVIKNGELLEKNFESAIDVPAPRENTIIYKVPSAEKLKVHVGHQKAGPIFDSGTRVVSCRVIGIIKNSIITDDMTFDLPVCDGVIERLPAKDILKIAVLERYGHGSSPSVGFVKGMGLKAGAIGSSVGHDSHNVVVIGANDLDMIWCFKEIQAMGGGFVVVKNGKVLARLALPVAGLMTEASIKEVSQDLKGLKKAARSLGCKLSDPFLQMAFLCLPVIPSLKITDRGLVDVKQFQFTPVEVGL